MSRNLRQRLPDDAPIAEKAVEKNKELGRVRAVFSCDRVVFNNRSRIVHDEIDELGLKM